MMTVRVNDWLERLTVYLETVRAQSYHRVDHNCGSFILGVIEAVTGETADEVLSRLDLEMPDSEFGVARVLAERGDMQGLCEAYFGQAADPAKLCARRGDIVLFDGEDGDAIGVMENGGALVLTETGLWHRPLIEARGFWRLG